MLYTSQYEPVYEPVYESTPREADVPAPQPESWDDVMLLIDMEMLS